MKAAAVQMTSGLDVARNLETARRLLQQAAAAGAQLAVLPENFALMARRNQERLDIVETDGDAAAPIQNMLSAAAHDFRITVVGGTMALQVSGDERVAPASLVYGPDGTRLGRYDKIHLFDVDVPDASESHRESAGFVAGQEVKVIDTPAGKLGVAVCYDLRFPELFRRMSELGADCFVVSAAFTVPTGEAHWDLLTRTRAVENLCHLVISAQVGEHENGRKTYGHSAVIDCWGRVVDSLPIGEGIAIGEIDLDYQARVRREFPALTHRMPDVINR
jgi:deaminated glutathione amidase